MDISYGDQLFVYFDDDKLPKNKNYSYFGNDFGTVGGFYQYIQGYIVAAETLFEKYDSCDHFRNNILDTIVYPICFNYRQIVELYIKYLYFKYSNVDDSSKQNFVKRVSHNLNEAWSQTKPYLQRLLQKINNQIDILLFDDFIIQIDNFDTDSFRMRYPIKKNLSSVHSKQVKLDVIGLHHKMMSLFELFRQLDESIEYVLLDNECADGFIDTIKELYCDSKADIVSIIKQLRYLANIENTEQNQSLLCAESVISNFDLQVDQERQKLEQMVLQLPVRHAALLGILLQTGCTIVDGRYRLANEQEERNKDFFKLLEMTLQDCSDFIDLGGCYPCSKIRDAFFDKSAEVLLKWLERSFSLMESSISM